MTPRILLDIDGVCADYTAPVLVAINTLLGTSYQEEDVTGWDIYETLNVPPDIAKQVDTVIQSQGFCEHVIEPYPGAVTGVGMLKEMGHVIPVTAPTDGPFWIQERKAWLKTHLGFYRREVVFADSNKFICNGDFLIEDKVSTLVAWQAEHPTGLGILFDRPWNKGEEWSGLRVNSWSHLVALVKSLIGGAS